jgi:hypothetical protein
MERLPVGTKVIPSNYLGIRAVGEGNIGTIIYVQSDFYIISWKNKGPKTYYNHQYNVKNMWNMPISGIEVYKGSDIDTDIKVESKYSHVILKIEQLKLKRKEKGYVF